MIIKTLFYRIKSISNILFMNRVKGVSIWYKLNYLKIYGKGNIVEIKSHIPSTVKIIIYGCNHKLIIDEGVTFKKGSIWFED